MTNGDIYLFFELHLINCRIKMTALQSSDRNMHSDKPNNHFCIRHHNIMLQSFPTSQTTARASITLLCAMAWGTKMTIPFFVPAAAGVMLLQNMMGECCGNWGRRTWTCKQLKEQTFRQGRSWIPKGVIKMTWLHASESTANVALCHSTAWSQSKPAHFIPSVQCRSSCLCLH